MSRKDNILSLQNPILKIFVSLILIFISSIISFDKFLIVFTFTLLYMIISPIIYIIWLKTLVKITPFFISLYIFGILFQIPFLDQCFLSVRIIHLLLVSVYLVKTSSFDSFISGNKSKDSEFWFKFKFFLAATIHFIPILTNKFKDNRKSHKNIIDVIVFSMEDCFKEIHKVEETVINKVGINNERLNASFWANIYLSLLVIIPVLFIFINYK
ncbi:MAG: hypothetical protein KAS53_03175 [Candidatus Cloacimonetes bacterium]|nr:hypothetical protein [Candidatus Cloacimonadota bacterium]